MIWDFEEHRILEVPDEFQTLYVEWSPGERLSHVEWLREWRAPDRGRYSGITLGAYRRAKSMQGITRAVIETWVPCARQESATGVPWPHCFFKQIVGRRGHAEDGSIYCPGCRTERPWERRQRSEAPRTKQLSLF